MVEIEVSDGECRILMDYQRRAFHILVHSKAEAILLAAPGTGANIMGCSRNGPRRSSWNSPGNDSPRRLASTGTGPAGNLNASKLDKQQRTEVLRVLAEPS
jgi:hypothetical protein